MDFVRENPPSHGQVVDFEILIRETPHVYGQTEHFESTALSNKDHSSEQDSLAPQKTKHPCRLTEVSEAEQRHSPRRIAKHPEQSGLLPLSGYYQPFCQRKFLTHHRHHID